MADQILNVNNEMNRMERQIAEIGHCTGIVRELSANSALYQTNSKINIITIVATLYQIAAAVVQYNKPLLFVGVMLALASAIVLFTDKSLLAYTDCIFVAAMYISAFVFFMYFYTFVPVIFTFIQWMIVLVSNFRMKKQVWNISRSV